MSQESLDLKPGQKVQHLDFGEGVVVGIDRPGYVRVFFKEVGERQVAESLLTASESWIRRVVSGLKPATPEALEKLWLAIEAVRLPLMESAATLTSAKVDLLPHQIVLVHRIANARPKRYLIADEVGLGKTIEAALILRELASRGELNRALMVVPAGLVDNWRRELNDVFNLDFEVFGYEGDITDRRSNAFAKHNRLIVSVDTLKRRPRLKRLLDAPQWDLVVFDEAHHLSVYKNGNKVRKTENFKLAEALRDHCRDLLLLSATPHQGDHFRFWMLVRLLDPGLFADDRDMLDNRHRLNAVVIRRTKADACAQDGSPLFARRMVHTQGFKLSSEEAKFYAALLEYLRDGYNLAALQGNQGRALGFVMTIFQKIAASSFAAVKATLRRRLLMLTIEDAIECDEVLNVDKRDVALKEALKLIMEVNGLDDTPVGRAQAEQILADTKVQLLKKRHEAASFVTTAESYGDTEAAALHGEDTIALIVTSALPEERRRIRELLDHFPQPPETKTQVLLEALTQLWQMNPQEKMVVFTTYLGSIDSIRESIEQKFPGKGVEVLKGGDHGAKIAAQKRFRKKDGPQVLLCTAAGREGINLQFARVLFNFDLPWNPMDLEQRIGRIHRYGQKYTAQVYNLVAADTIEGQIYLLLEEKLKGIAQTLGKVDEHGQVAEDLRTQILGQLSSRLSYDRLYQEAILDPTLKRTRLELEVALSNANQAREVVFELFQDLQRFNVGDYEHYRDEGRGMKRLQEFVERAAKAESVQVNPVSASRLEMTLADGTTIQYTIDRNEAMDQESLSLLGLEDSMVQKWLARYSSLQPEERTVLVSKEESATPTGLVSFWHVVAHGSDGRISQEVRKIAVDDSGQRSEYLERMVDDFRSMFASTHLDVKEQLNIGSVLDGRCQELLHRDLVHSGIVNEHTSYSTRLIGCVVVA